MFEWDAKKAAANLARHTVTFGEAATVFGNPMALDGPDVGHSAAEARFVRLGRWFLNRVLTVAWRRVGRPPIGSEARQLIAIRLHPDVLDLVGAYLPMAWLGARIGNRRA